MTRVNMHEAKTHLSRLVAKAMKGDEVIIAKAGKPLVALVPVVPTGRKRAKFGFLKGKIWMSPDFDAPDPELERLWYDGPIEPADTPDKGK